MRGVRAIKANLSSCRLIMEPAHVELPRPHLMLRLGTVSSKSACRVSYDIWNMEIVIVPDRPQGPDRLLNFVGAGVLEPPHNPGPTTGHIRMPNGI